MRVSQCPNDLFGDDGCDVRGDIRWLYGACVALLGSGSALTGLGIAAGSPRYCFTAVFHLFPMICFWCS